MVDDDPGGLGDCCGGGGEDACVFAKALLARHAGCGLVQRRALGERVAGLHLTGGAHQLRDLAALLRGARPSRCTCHAPARRCRTSRSCKCSAAG
jgi:hypothetical protein